MISITASISLITHIMMTSSNGNALHSPRYWPCVRGTTSDRWTPPPPPTPTPPPPPHTHPHPTTPHPPTHPPPPPPPPHPHKGPMAQSSDVFFNVRLNKLFNKEWSRRWCDITVMVFCQWETVMYECVHSYFSSLRPPQKGRHFADDIFICIADKENFWFSK